MLVSVLCEGVNRGKMIILAQIISRKTFSGHGNGKAGKTAGPQSRKDNLFYNLAFYASCFWFRFK
jgi:hypothetical protein